MKTFVINLLREVGKRNELQRQCEELNLDFEIYDAIDGRALSDCFLKENVLDYGCNYLTNGEIGCSLSHINIYKKIISDGLDYALILEDDAVLSWPLVDFISSFEKERQKEGIYLLTGDVSYVENKCRMLSSFRLYPVKDATRTTGYIITNYAARAMVDFLLPVKFEADMYTVFKTLTGVSIYVTIPHIISTNDKDKANSSLESERCLLVENRRDYRNNLFKNLKKKRSVKLKASAFLWRMFARKTEKVKKYSQY